MPRLLRFRAAALLCALVLAACTATATFDPGRPCGTDGSPLDGRAAGAYPQLEALIPATFDGRSPNRLDSGRNCSDRNLGSLRARGVTEVRFAGGVWETGARSGVSLAVFQAERLTLSILFEFYESGARAAPKTDQVVTGDLTVGAVAARRLDTLNDDSFQTVITWPGADGTVRVVLVGSDVREVQTRAAHETVVAAALAAVNPAR